MNKMVQNVTQPWLIIGYFNALLSPKNRLAGAPVNLNEIKDFADCVKVMGINELQWIVVTILGIISRLVMLESQAGLIEPLGMMHEWINGGMSY